MYQGLTTAQANKIIQKNGFNEIPEKHVSIFQKIIKNLLSPIALMLVAASLLSFWIHKIFDGNFILVLLVLNITITLWQENKADNAIKKLNEHLEQKIKVFRDQKWQSINSRSLVIGDIVQLASGEIIPADGTIVEAHHLSINESALTGESLPKDKKENDPVFSGSFITTGITVVKITATGVETKFGKTMISVERVRKQSLLEKDIISISKFLTFLSFFAVTILSAILLTKKAPILELLTLDLSLIIAGIPISLPTVMTLIIELGVLRLAKKNVVIRRLSALEDLSNITYILTDKTGTLTQNKITIQDVYAYDGFTHNDVLLNAAIVAANESDNPIDQAIIEKVNELRLQLPKYDKIDFIPADSERKRSTIILKRNSHESTICIGAPQIVKQLCTLDKKTDDKFDREVALLASSGYRTLAIAISDTKLEKNMKIVGFLGLSDTLRPDAKSVIEFLAENGIDVSMVTGDNRAIAAQVSRQLGFANKDIVSKDSLDKMDWKSIKADFFKKTGSFAEVLPDDKFHLVQKANEFYVVAANGDGINDLPAIKAANVGIAVKNAVTVLKATADIVLLSQGISVIRDAIIESRKIFERLYTYSLYRISESLRLIVTIAVLGIIYQTYPMTALQIILIALLNDIPIISLATDRVKIKNRPAKINVKERFVLSSLYGLVGVANSLLLFFLAKNFFHLDWKIIQTMFFLKLTVSGHMLIYVAHTKDRWYKFFPSKEVILATTITQLVASLLAWTGFLMPTHLSLFLIMAVWLWALFWMQISELAKIVQKNLEISFAEKNKNQSNKDI